MSSLPTRITRDILEGYLNCKDNNRLKLAGEQGTRSANAVPRQGRRCSTEPASMNKLRAGVVTSAAAGGLNTDHAACRFRGQQRFQLGRIERLEQEVVEALFQAAATLCLLAKAGGGDQADIA